MLIEAPYKKHDTITVKINSGDEIVGRFVEENDTTLTIQKPLALMATQQGIGLGPYAFTVPQGADIRLNKHSILFVAKTDTEMAKQYISSTTGVQMV